MRENAEAWPTVNADNHWIFFAGIEIARVEEPGLDFVAAVFEMETLGFAPTGLDGFVALRDLRPLRGGASPNFGRCAEGAADDGGGFAVAGERKIDAPSAGG